MAGRETKIMEALMDHLSDLTLDPTMSVSWPGLNFTPPRDNAGKPKGYLKASFLPAETVPFAVRHRGTNDHRGVFQVDVFWPENQGETTPSDTAAAIIDHFKRGTKLYREGVKVEVIRPPYRSPALQEPGYLQIPVNIPYVVFTAS